MLTVPRTTGITVTGEKFYGKNARNISHQTLSQIKQTVNQ